MIHKHGEAYFAQRNSRAGEAYRAKPDSRAPSNPHIRKMLFDAGFECIDLALAFLKGIGVAFD